MLFAGGKGTEQHGAFLVQDYMAPFATLARSNVDRLAIGIKVRRTECRQLTVARAGYQCGLNESTKVRVARIDQSLCLINRQISRARCVNIVEWLNAAPCRIRRNLSLSPSTIQRGPEDRKCSICARAARPDGVWITFGDPAKILL